MDDDRYTRITLRIPRNLHSKLQDSSDATSKSMNAEIVARLDESFSSAPMSSEAADVMRALVAASENQEKLIRAQHALLMKMGDMMALALNLGSPPKGERGQRLHSISKAFAEAIARDDLAGAMEPMIKLMEIGKQSGILVQDGRVKSELVPALDHPRPRRKLDV